MRSRALMEVRCSRSDSHAGWGCEQRMFNVAGIACSGRLEQEALHFLISDRPVLDAVRHNQEFPRPQLHCPVAQFNAHRAANGKEELILPVVAMPDKLAAEFDKFHFLTIEFAHNPRAPVLGDRLHLFGNVDLVHISKVANASRRNN